MKLTFVILSLAAIDITECLKFAHLTHQGKFAWYTFKESPEGACSDDRDCDGLRYCAINNYLCKGEARPQKNEKYIYYEAITAGGCVNWEEHENYANRDYYCDGNRYCNNEGICEGTAR